MRLALVAAACAAAAWSCLGWRAGVQAASKLTPQERRGKLIYLKGDGGPDEIITLLGGSDLELPAASFPCSNCHGLAGEGTREGGIQPPPIDWETLTSRQTSALTRRERAPYTEESLARAIRGGIGPGGGGLNPAMPRYSMTAGQMADLIAYLKKLGKDVDPGVGEESIKVGAALPLTGPLAQVGEDVKATLAACFNEVNARGGIYGRRFELAVADSRGEPAATAAAARRLLEVEEVFALVGSFEPRGSEATGELLRRSEVPLVGPVTLSPRLAVPPNPYIFYLLPTFGDQARSLVDFVGSKEAQIRRGPPGAGPAPAARLAVVYADTEFDRDALTGFKSQAEARSMEVVAELGYEPGRFSAQGAVERLARARPAYVFFFGGPSEIVAFAREMQRAEVDAALLTSVLMIGRGAFELPAGVAARTYLSYPAALPDGGDFAEFSAAMQRAKVKLRSPAFQAVAYAAARVFVEAVKSSGRGLNRAALVSGLERLRDFDTGVVPPLSFGPNRRVGAVGSYVVGIDFERMGYVPLSGWIVPKE